MGVLLNTEGQKWNTNLKNHWSVAWINCILDQVLHFILVLQDQNPNEKDLQIQNLVYTAILGNIDKNHKLKIPFNDNKWI